MVILFSVVLLSAAFVTLSFVFRVLCALNSEEVAEEMRRRWLLHVVWGFLAVLGIAVVLTVLNPSWWPPRFIERHAQRQKVQQIVRDAGGWQALRQACVSLAEGCKGEPEQWSWGDADRLPAAIAALHPQRVQFFPASRGDAYTETAPAVVRITLFGSHSTGGRGVAWLGLDVVCDEMRADCRPALKSFSNWHYRRIEDCIYEFY